MKIFKSPNWHKTLALLLPFALLLGVTVSCNNNSESDKGSNKGHALLDVIYPETYAFDDFDKEVENREDHPVQPSFLTALDEFAYRSTAALLLAQDEEQKNFNYSPLSLYFALALASTGAGENSKTQAELFDVLRVPHSFDSSTQAGTSAALLSTELHNLYQQIYRKNEIAQIKIANSLWLDDEVAGQEVLYNDEFVQNAAQNFYASVHNVDFSDEENTSAAMSAWVSEQTNGKIEPTFEFDPLQVLSIFNTVYFYDQWVNRFDESATVKDSFYLSDGSELKLDFMRQNLSSAAFTRGENYTRSYLPLKNNGQMIFVLPDEGIAPSELMDSAENIEKLLTEGTDFHGEVVWKMPKFSFDTKVEMKETLQALGVTAAFSGEADFTGISEQTELFINDIQQETHIAVDENGVEAAAFTQVNFATTALPLERVEMTLDRPFIFAITAANASLLFIGICENPAD